MERVNDLMVFDILPERKVVFLEHNINVQDTLSILDDKRISSAPVVNVSEGKFLGIVDMFDIVTCMLGVLPEMKEGDDPSAVEWAGEHFAKTTMGQVIEATNTYEGFPIASNPVKRETFLPKVIELFWLGLHRLPVVNMENNIINVLTQSDLLAFMAQNMHLIGAIARKTLDECNIGRVAPQMARANEQTSVVVKRLHNKRITALPVVDDEGKIIANFSISDLKGITSKNFKDLLLPVKAFLDKRSSQEENFRCERSLHPLTVHRHDPLEETIYKMVATRVHRLWVVDDSNRPIGTVSTTDLMRAFLQL